MISKNLIPIFLGEAFLKSSSILNILIFATLFVSINSIISSQYLMPNEFDKIYVGSILLGAITNTLLNFILIPKLSSIGAAYATLITEFLIMLYQIIKIRKKFKFIKYIKSSIKFLLSAVIMFIVGYVINYLHLNNLYSLLLKIIICSFVYLLLNIKYIKDNLKIGKIWKKCNSTSI